MLSRTRIRKRFQNTQHILPFKARKGKKGVIHFYSKDSEGHLQKCECENESMLNALSQAIPDQVWMMDQDLRIVWANEVARKRYGQNIVGEKCYKVFCSRTRPCEVLRCGSCLVFQDGQGRYFETRTNGNHGQSECAYFAANVALWDKHGKPAAVLTVGKDIAEWKRAQKPHHEGGGLYRIALSSISDAVFITDDVGAFTFVCPNVSVIFGFSSEEVWQKGNICVLLGENLFDLEGLKRKGELTNLELEIKNGRCETRTLLVNVKYGTFRKGTILYCCRDITEHKKDQEELYLAKSAIDTSLNAIGLADPEGIVTYVNDSFFKMWGYAHQEEVIGQPISAFVENPQEVFAIVAELEKSGQWCGEMVAKRKDGSTFDVELSSSLVRNARGEPISSLASFVDVTEQKKAERILRDSDRMKSEFIATAGHEMRTPLTAVQGFAEFLFRHPEIDYEVQRGYLAIIFDKANSLAKIIDDLLDLSRAESGQPICAQKRMADVKALVDQWVKQIQQETLLHWFVVRLPEKPIHLLIDESKMKQVFDNLLSNAVKYSSRGGPITITAVEKFPDFLFTIEDEGIGMTPEQVERVFDKFYRADGSNAAIAGLGLGMSIAKKIVEEHGGQIWVESELGRGTKVFFSFPMIIKD